MSQGKTTIFEEHNQNRKYILHPGKSNMGYHLQIEYITCLTSLSSQCYMWYMFTSGLFYLHGLTLIPAWISNYIHYKVWDEITYPFLNFNGCTVEV